MFYVVRFPNPLYEVSWRIWLLLCSSCDLGEGESWGNTCEAQGQSQQLSHRNGRLILIAVFPWVYKFKFQIVRQTNRFDSRLWTKLWMADPHICIAVFLGSTFASFTIPNFEAFILQKTRRSLFHSLKFLMWVSLPAYQRASYQNFSATRSTGNKKLNIRKIYPRASYKKPFVAKTCLVQQFEFWFWFLVLLHKFWFWLRNASYFYRNQ